jgi:hypothetical protein
VANRFSWFKLAIADLLFVSGFGCMFIKRYLLGAILIFIGIIYKYKYVN